MAKSELNDFTSLALHQKVIKTGGYYFEILTGWPPAFDTIFMVRSRQIFTKEIVIRIKVLWVLLQNEIGSTALITVETSRIVSN